MSEVREVRRSSDEWPTQLSDLLTEGRVDRIFVEGRRVPSEDGSVAVVGTRRPTSAGAEFARAVARVLADADFAVVSGLAIGIDTVAHRAALDAGGHTVAVLGTGIDIDYPRQNIHLKKQIAKRGTVVTELEAGAPPLTHHFPMRNRIIAGLSRGVVVVEGGERSGALITARQALDLGKQIWAVPGSTRNPMARGPNDLIRRGEAAPITAPDQIFEEIDPLRLIEEPTAQQRLPMEQLAAIEQEERDVLMAMDDHPIHPDPLAGILSRDARRVALSLTRLELKRLVARRPAGYEITGRGAAVREALFAAPD